MQLPTVFEHINPSARTARPHDQVKATAITMPAGCRRGPRVKRGQFVQLTLHQHPQNRIDPTESPTLMAASGWIWLDDLGQSGHLETGYIIVIYRFS